MSAPARLKQLKAARDEAQRAVDTEVARVFAVGTKVRVTRNGKVDAVVTMLGSGERVRVWNERSARQYWVSTDFVELP